MVKILAVILIIFSSCSIKEKSCKVQMKKIQENQSKIPENFTVKGLIYLRSIPVIFKGSFSKTEKISLFSPFGQKIASVKKENKTVCLTYKNLKQCGDDTLYRQLLDIDIPVKIKYLIAGKVNFSKNAKIYCKNGNTFVEDKNIRYIFENGMLKEIIYDSYRLEYGYNNEIKIYKKGKKISTIKIKQIEKAK